MRKEKPTPLYKKLIHDLKKLVDDGHYKKGDLLPSENDLCKTYATTRPTVRQALNALTGMGYIVRHHGKGSIVAEPKMGLGILSISGVTAGVGDRKLKTTLLEKPQISNWPDKFFYELNDEERAAGCIFFSRVRYISNAPVLFEETFISNISLPGFTEAELENSSLFKTLKEQFSVEIKEGEQKIWAVEADKKTAKLLKLVPGNPVLHLKRKLKTNIKNLHIYSWLYANTAEYFLQDNF